MGNAYGTSGQGGTITVGGVGPLKVTRMKLRKKFDNADTTVTDNGWDKLCPIKRGWFIDVEMPARSGDDSITIVDTFDDDAFNTDDEDPVIPDITFSPPGSLGSWTGSGMLDGDVEVDDDEKDAVRLRFTIRGSDALTPA